MESILAFLAVVLIFVLLDRLTKGLRRINETLSYQNQRFDDMGKIIERLRALEKLLHEKETNVAQKQNEPHIIYKQEVAEELIITETDKIQDVSENITTTITEEFKPAEEPVARQEAINDAGPALNSNEAVKDEVKYEEPYFKTRGEGPSVFISQPKEKRDFEKFIGENVINKIGIGILVLGIGFFVKYAIDKNWIGESFRVLIGVFCGSLLLGIAHRMHKSYKAFSSVLMGGGLAVYYLTIAIGYHQYHIFSQASAFGIMVAITALAVALALIYNRQEVAVLAIIGGFGTPFFLSNGQGDYVTLFIYLLILDIGMIVLAGFKKWPLLNIISYVFTILIFSGWFVTYTFPENSVDYGRALIFASAFYLVFFLMNIIHNVTNIKRFNGLDFSILLSNSFLYYVTGMYILFQMHLQDRQGAFTAGLMLFNMVMAYFVLKQTKADKNLYYLLIGLVVSFFSLFAPVQLNGSYITLYWSAEAVLMLWLSQKSGITLLRVGSLITNVLAIISLITVWSTFYIYSTFNIPVVINKAFITGLFSIGCIITSRYLLKREGEFFLPFLPGIAYRKSMGLVSFLLLYIVPLLELGHHMHVYAQYTPLYYMVMLLYNFAFVACWLLYSMYKKEANNTWLSSVSGYLIVIVYMSFYFGITQNYLYNATHSKGPGFTTFYLVHIPALMLISGILYYATRNFLRLIAANWKSLIYWYMAFAVVFIASIEVFNMAIFIHRNDEISMWKMEEDISKIAFPVLWGICAFIFMRSGMRHKNRTLRIISLALLLLTVIKLFVYDISNVSEVGKIIAFICLGVLLLVISFMYQKIRKIIFDADPNNVNQESNEP